MLTLMVAATIVVVLTGFAVALLIKSIHIV